MFSFSRTQRSPDEPVCLPLWFIVLNAVIKLIIKPKMPQNLTSEREMNYKEYKPDVNQGNLVWTKVKIGQAAGHR